MIAYYLVDAGQIEQAEQYALASGLPNQLFQIRMNNNGTKAIARADWLSNEIANIGQYLGKLVLPEGTVEPGILDELAKLEW